MLLSFALQMAMGHPEIRQELAKLLKDNVVFDKDDERAIWREVFVTIIFKILLGKPQYWLIDALDECVDHSKLFPLLSRIQCNYAIQILITSRPWPEFERQFLRLGHHKVVIDAIAVGNTSNDIRTFHEDNMDTLPVRNEVDRSELMEELVKKADGCFLWARLVLQELQSVYSEEQIRDVIDDLPGGMGSMYRRILREMSRNKRETRLTKTLLVWALCAIRPLHTSELLDAIGKDEGIKMPSLERSIQGLCGQLLHVDKTGWVQILHATTRTFITDASLESEFAVSNSEGSRQLALTCLNYLSGEMRPPRNRAILDIPRKPESAIADYACVAFSDHLATTSSLDDAVLLTLERFLKTNVLTWVEYIARTRKNLSYLTQTAKNLKIYLDMRAQCAQPLGEPCRYISQWATDLVRLVAKFGRNLLECPESIYYLITPFCPRRSAINQTFLDPGSSLTIAGVANDGWEDSISYIHFRENRAMSLATGDNTFAIGTKSGRVVLFWQTTCQERMTLEHGELARILRFDNSHRLACAGPHKISLWSLDSQTLLWMHVMKDTPIHLQFSLDDRFMITATRRSHAITLACKDGTFTREQSFRNQQAPLDVAVSPDCKIIAFAYRGKAVLLWSLESDQLLGTCGGLARSTDMMENFSAQQVIFNTNLAIELMVVAFQDGSILLYDTWKQRAVKTVHTHCYHMACSPDGQTLVTSCNDGRLFLWDFKILSIKYVINTHEAMSKALAFTQCGTRIIDLQARKAKVWEPPVLIHRVDEDDSDTNTPAALPSVTDYLATITSTCIHPRKDIIFVGKGDGTLSIYSTGTGEPQSILYSHRQNMFIHKTVSNVGNVVASDDASNTVMVYEFEERPDLPPSTKQPLNHRLDLPVQQVVLNSTGDRLLVSTTTTDSL